MGGGTTIEATEPVVIPAYTDKEITIVPQGVQGIDYGMVTVSGDLESEITVSHNLGVVPSHAFLISDKFLVDDYRTWGIHNIYVLYKKRTDCYERDIGTETEYLTKTDKEITFYSYGNPGTFPFDEGVTYYWFALA